MVIDHKPLEVIRFGCVSCHKSYLPFLLFHHLLLKKINLNPDSEQSTFEHRKHSVFRWSSVCGFEFLFIFCIIVWIKTIYNWNLTELNVHMRFKALGAFVIWYFTLAWVDSDVLFEFWVFTRPIRAIKLFWVSVVSQSTNNNNIFGFSICSLASQKWPGHDGSKYFAWPKWLLFVHFE